MRKIALLVLAGLVAFSIPAWAKRCPKGQRWDKTQKACVAKTPAAAPKAAY